MNNQIPLTITVDEVLRTLESVPPCDITGFFRCLSLFWTRDRIAVLLAAYSASLIERGQDEIDITSILSDVPATSNQKKRTEQ